MMEGWKEVKLEEVTSKLGDGLHGTPKYDDKGEYYFVNGNNLQNGKIIFKEDTKRISKNEYEKIKKELNERTILVAINGTLGNVGLYKGQKIALGKSACYFNVKVDTDKQFIRYVIESPLFQNYAPLYATGATIKNLSLKAMRKFSFHLPPLPTQHKIAKILSAYDDLIEYNLKRIKLLEEMAQKTYEEWFVRFKFPGHETAEFDKETGLPEGWKKEKLNNYLSIKHGYAYKGKYFTEIETNRILLTPGNFKIGGGIQMKKVKYYSDTADCPNDYILKRNDLLLTMTDLSKMGDTLGYPLLIPSSDKLFLHNQRLGKVQLIRGNYLPKYFLYFLFKDEGYRAFVVGSSSGATVKHTSPNKILSYKAKFPDIESGIVKEFERKVKPTFDNVDNLQTQNQHLKEARDILLPRLMTGMIDVDKIETEL